MKNLFFMIGMIWQLGAFANSLTLVNNSPFPLSATLYGASGAVLGQYSLNPQEQVKWSDDNDYSIDQNAKQSETPYTVIWSCQSGGEYGVCTQLSPGSMTFSQSCPGQLMCKPMPKQQVQPPATGGTP